MKIKNLYIAAFKKLGTSWTASSSLIQTLEMFVRELYGQPSKSSVNNARYAIFKFKFKIDVSSPPNYDALACHINRGNYQAHIHRQGFQNMMNVSNPGQYGWIVDKGNINICWNTKGFFADKHFLFLSKDSLCIK